MYVYFSICSLLLEGSPAVFIPFFLLVSSVRIESNGRIIFLQNIRGETYFCGIQRSCLIHVLYPLVIITALWEVSATGMVKRDVTFSGFLGHEVAGLKCVLQWDDVKVWNGYINAWVFI